MNDVAATATVSESEKELATTDINEAAVLQTLRFKLVDLRTRTDRTRGGKRQQTEFVFRGSGLHTARLSFANREVDCNAFNLLANLRTLKAMSHNRIKPKDRVVKPDDETDAT